MRSDKQKGLSESSLKGLSDEFFICQRKYLKKVESRVPKMSRETMQALRLLTKFDSFRKESWQWR